jgi:hypothetical protein
VSVSSASVLGAGVCQPRFRKTAAREFCCSVRRWQSFFTVTGPGGGGASPTSILGTLDVTFSFVDKGKQSRSRFAFSL